MRRRESITLFVGASVVWPIAARSQQGERMRQIDILMKMLSVNSEGQQRVVALFQQLKELGWVSDGNIRVNIRWAGVDAGTFKHA
jgi:putative ABC transport system substrate-binding protein